MLALFILKMWGMRKICQIQDNGRGFLPVFTRTTPYTTIGYQFWIASIFYNFKPICLKLCMQEMFVDIFDSQKAFWDWRMISKVSEIGVFTIFHYGVSRNPWPFSRFYDFWARTKLKSLCWSFAVVILALSSTYF